MKDTTSHKVAETIDQIWDFRRDLKTDKRPV